MSEQSNQAPMDDAFSRIQQQITLFDRVASFQTQLQPMLHMPENQMRQFQAMAKMFAPLDQRVLTAMHQNLFGSESAARIHQSLFDSYIPDYLARGFSRVSKIADYIAEQQERAELFEFLSCPPSSKLTAAEQEAIRVLNNVLHGCPPATRLADLLDELDVDAAVRCADAAWELAELPRQAKHSRNQGILDTVRRADFVNIRIAEHLRQERRIAQQLVRAFRKRNVNTTLLAYGYEEIVEKAQSVHTGLCAAERITSLDFSIPWADAGISYLRYCNAELHDGLQYIGETTIGELTDTKLLRTWWRLRLIEAKLDQQRIDLREIMLKVMN